MRLWDVALAHLKLRKGRTAFLLLGMLLCLGTLVSLYILTDSLQEQLQRQMEQAGIRFLITPESLQATDSYQGVPVGPADETPQILLPQEYLEEIRQLELVGLDLIAPKLVLASEIMGQQVLLCGLDFQGEDDLQSWWQLESGGFPQRPQEILAGTDLASSLGLKPGDQIRVSGRSYQIAGILLPTGGGEDKLFLMDLGELQSLTGVDGVSLVELRFWAADEPGEADFIAREWIASLEETLPGAKITRVRDENHLRQDMLAQLIKFSGYGALIVFLINWLMVAVALMSSVKERVGEIGILRAIGYRQKHIIQIIMLEAGIISSLGGIFGFVSGIGLGGFLVSLLGDEGITWNWEPRFFSWFWLYLCW